MKRYLFFVLMAAFVFVAKAQNNPFPGYVITNNGDTIHGTLDLESNRRLSKHCKFMAEDKSVFTTYTPEEIEGFRFENNGKYFVSRRFSINGNDHLYFAEYLVQGNMNLYSVVEESDTYFFFERSDGELVCVKDVRTIDQNNYKETEAAQAQSMANLKGLLSDSKKAKGELYHSYYTKQQYVDIVKKYHEDTCRPGEKCIEFEYNASSEHDKPHFKIIVGGSYVYHLDIPEMKAYPGAPGVGSKMLFNGGVGMDFSLAKVLRGLYVDATLLGSCYTAKTNGRPEKEGKYDARSRVLLLNLNLGGKYYVINSGVRPFVGAGLSLTYGLYPGYRLITNGGEPSNYTHVMPQIMVGPYVGGGVAIPVGKHNLNVRLNATPLGKLRQVALTTEFVL